MPTTQEMPRQFGRYQIERKLGQGGMGAVYLALDPRLNRWVALKVPHFDGSENSTVIARFEREARLAGGIHHPNLCPVFDVGEIDGVHYFTMPYIEGTPLSKLVGEDRPWNPAQAAILMAKVGSALAQLHAHGIIHRDLKPANIMILPSGEPILMDFGLARAFEGHEGRLSTTGPIGTPAYMSPEQVNGERDQGPATDVYSLGVMLFELLTGRRPFTGPTVAVYAQILTNPAPPPSSLRPEIDAAMDTIVLKALAKKPSDRYATAADMVQALMDYAAQSMPVAASSGLMRPGSSATVSTLPQPASQRKETVPSTCPPSEFGGTTLIQGQNSVIWMMLLLAVVSLATVSLAAFVFFGRKKEETPIVQVPTSPATPATVPPITPRPTTVTRTEERPELTIAEPAVVDLTPGQTRTVYFKVRRKHLPGRIRLVPVSSVTGVEVAVGEEDWWQRIPVEVSVEPFARRGLSTLRFEALVNDRREGSDVSLRVNIREPGLKSRLTTSTGLTLVYIPAGKFKMGSPNNEAGRWDEEGPQHEVEISRAFWMGIHEVTLGQFRQFVKESGHKTWAEINGRGGFGLKNGEFVQGTEFNWQNTGFPQEDDHPVVNITREDAIAFCQWLSNKEKKIFDLPTEAEWEFACRAGFSTRFWFGDDEKELPKYDNVRDASARARFPNWMDSLAGDDKYVFTSPAAKFPANPWGLHGLHGNVSEWCVDAKRIYVNQAQKNPIGPRPTGLQLPAVQRGGSFFHTARGCRSAYRGDVSDEVSCWVGFRVILREVRRAP